MKAHHLLFLLGGGPTIFDTVAKEFIPAAGGPDATIALLLAGGQGWEEHVPQYTVRIVPGLGLVSGLIVGVHFTKWNALPHMVEAMVETRTATGLGIDEAACAVLENGKLERVLGQSAYKVELTDFEAKTCRVTNAA